MKTKGLITMKPKIKKGLFSVVGLSVLIGAILYLLSVNGKTSISDLTLYGNVDIREVDLGFRVSGKLKEVFVDEGDPVKPGDLICTLDNRPYMEKAWQAKAEMQSAKIALVNGKQQLQRRRIAQISSAISEEEFENAKLNYASLKASLKAAQANLASAMTDYDDCKCYAPSSGYILTRAREPGSILNVGETVFTVALDTPVWIRAYIDEPDLGKITYGMPALIYTDTDSNPVYKGHIGFISSVAEFTPKNVESPRLRTDLVFRLRIIVDNPDQGLKQGMPVTIKLVGDGENIKGPTS